MPLDSHVNRWSIYDAQGGVATAKLNNSVSPIDYQSGALAYIDKAFAWGAKYGIGKRLWQQPAMLTREQAFCCACTQHLAAKEVLTTLALQMLPEK